MLVPSVPTFCDISVRHRHRRVRFWWTTQIQQMRLEIMGGFPKSVPALMLRWHPSLMIWADAVLTSVLGDLGRPAAIIVMDVLLNTFDLCAVFWHTAVSLRRHHKSLYQWTINYDRGKHVLPVKPNRTANFLSEPRFWWIFHCASVYTLNNIRLTESCSICCMLKNKVLD